MTDEMRIKRAGIFNRLKSLKVRRVEIGFSGSGDGGGIDEIEAYGFNHPTGPPRDRIELPVDLREDIEQLGDWAIESQGWSFNDDGCSGVISLIVNADRIEYEHNSYFTDAHTSKGKI